MHTPGPWKVVTGAVVRASDEALIASMDRSEYASKAGIYPVERDENARLIAAAPDLLRLLQLACSDDIDVWLDEAKDLVEDLT